MQRRQCFGFAVKYSRPQARKPAIPGGSLTGGTGNIKVCFPASSGVGRRHDTLVDGFGAGKMLPTRMALTQAPIQIYGHGSTRKIRG